METNVTLAFGRSDQCAHRILVCLDGTAASDVCAAYGIALAQTYGSDVILVHVMQPSSQMQPGTDPLSWEIYRQQMQRYLQRQSGNIAQALGRSVETRIEQGQPAARIIAIAREIDADVVVVGPSTTEVGHTFDQLVASLGRSVLVARGGSALRRILVPLDGSPRAESIIPNVARIALRSQAQVLLVHVVQAPDVTAPLYEVEDMELAQHIAKRIAQSAQRYLDAIALRFRNDGIDARPIVVRHAAPGQRLLELSQSLHADLLIVSAHGASNSDQPFGNMTTYLLNNLNLPILMLQDRVLHDSAALMQPQPAQFERRASALDRV